MSVEEKLSSRMNTYQTDNIDDNDVEIISENNTSDAMDDLFDDLFSSADSSNTEEETGFNSDDSDGQTIGDDMFDDLFEDPDAADNSAPDDNDFMSGYESGYEAIIDDGIIDDGDIETSELYSEDFLRNETDEFIKTLNQTLKYRQNRSGDVDESPLLQQRYQRRKMNTGKVKNEKIIIGIIKQVLDSVRQYNKTLIPGQLPEYLQKVVQKNEKLQYADKDEHVWHMIETKIRSDFSNQPKVINNFNADVTKIYTKYEILCSQYAEEDIRDRKAEISRRRADVVNKLEFAFYYECLRRLGSENVALCNHIVFSSKDQMKYKFRCGHCGKIVEGTHELETESGDKIKEGATHNFYEVMTSPMGNTSEGTLYGLYYPLVCEDCGAINCLSYSTRNMMQENINAELTGESLDKTEYRATKIDNRKGYVYASDRRTIPQSKWQDLLKNKLFFDPDIDTLRMSMDTINDMKFTIESEDDTEDNVDEKITSINMDDYRDAIKRYRDNNQVINTMNSLESDDSGDIDNKIALAILANKGNITMLLNAYDGIISYILTTESFSKLINLFNSKNDAYDEFLTFNTMYHMIAIGENVEDGIKNEICDKYHVEWSSSVARDRRDKALSEYRKLRSSYDEFRKEFLSHPEIFAFSRSSKKPGTLKILMRVLEFHKDTKKFLKDVLRNVIFNRNLTDARNSFGSRVRGIRIASEPIKGLRKSGGQDNIVFNKLTTIMQYTKAAEKNLRTPNGDKFTIRETIMNFDSYFRVYITFNEWCNMFNISKSMSIADVLNRENNRDLRKFYDSRLADTLGSIDSKIGAIGDMLPAVESLSAFKIMTGIEDLADVDITIKRDAIRAFTIFLDMDKFSVYDMLFFRCLSYKIGVLGYAGMSKYDIAKNLRATNGMVLKSISKEDSKVDSAMSIDCIRDAAFDRFVNHRFLNYHNFEENLTILKKSSDDEDYTDNDVVEAAVAKQVEFIKEELGTDTEMFSVEFPI